MKSVERRLCPILCSKTLIISSWDYPASDQPVPCFYRTKRVLPTTLNETILRFGGKHLTTAWDLGFETSVDGFHVILNTSKTMFAKNTGTTNFNAVRDTMGFSFTRKWDDPSGNLDSTAIGDWRKSNTVYIIDRGYSETGAHQGFRKIHFRMLMPQDTLFVLQS